MLPESDVDVVARNVRSLSVYFNWERKMSATVFGIARINDTLLRTGERNF